MQSSNLQREVVESDQDFEFERNKLGVLLTKKSATSLDFEFPSDSAATIFFRTCVGVVFRSPEGDQDPSRGPSLWWSLL